MDPRTEETLKQSKYIFLDMDGVCCDHLKALHEVHGREFKAPTQWDLEIEWGMTREEFWQPVLDAGPEFWINLEEFPWFRDLYNKLSSYGEVVFLTSSTDHVSAHGKVIWLKERLGQDFQNYILCTRLKHLLAQEDRVLIDDSPKYCEKFKESGGKVIQFKWEWMPEVEDTDGAIYPMGEHLYTKHYGWYCFC